MFNTNRFKFRAWLIDQEKMVNVSEIYLSYNQDDLDYYGERFIAYFKDQNCAKYKKQKGYSSRRNTYLMQSTGIIDSNDKLIFEGDIVEYGDNIDSGIYIVKYHSDNEYPAFDLYHHEEEYNLISHAIIELDCFIKVIGNIYENPNILNRNNIH